MLLSELDSDWDVDVEAIGVLDEERSVEELDWDGLEEDLVGEGPEGELLKTEPEGTEFMDLETLGEKEFDAADGALELD